MNLVWVFEAKRAGRQRVAFLSIELDKQRVIITFEQNGMREVITKDIKRLFAVDKRSRSRATGAKTTHIRKKKKTKTNKKLQKNSKNNKRI